MAEPKIGDRRYIQSPLRARKELGMTLHAGEQSYQGLPPEQCMPWQPNERKKKRKGKKR